MRDWNKLRVMSEKEQIQHFVEEITKVVTRFRAEYQLTYASVIGALQIIIMDLYREARGDDDDLS